MRLTRFSCLVGDRRARVQGEEQPLSGGLRGRARGPGAAHRLRLACLVHRKYLNTVFLTQHFSLASGGAAFFSQMESTCTGRRQLRVGQEAHEVKLPY